jgi:hypothetical protein
LHSVVRSNHNKVHAHCQLPLVFEYCGLITAVRRSTRYRSMRSPGARQQRTMPALNLGVIYGLFLALLGARGRV